MNVYVTVPPGAASCVSRPATPPELATLKPGNRIDVLPAEAGRPLVSVTLTDCPSVTTSVGPGTCMVWQNGATLVAGTKRESTRLNSSHSQISYAVFCLKKKN